MTDDSELETEDKKMKKDSIMFKKDKRPFIFKSYRGKRNPCGQVTIHF